MPYRHLFTKASSYLGLDLEASSHGLSKPDATFDGTTIPFEDNRFDSVVSFEVIDDLSHPAVQLAEIHRVLKPGGALLVTTSFVWELHEEPHDIARYTDHGLRTLLEDSGFEIEMLHKEGHYTRTIGQLQAMYCYQTLQKLPLGVVAGVAIAGIIQFVTLIIEHLLPKRRELYLSNIVIARRV